MLRNFRWSNGRSPTASQNSRSHALQHRALIRWSERHCCFFKCLRKLRLGGETKPDISCEWKTKFSIIGEIPSKRVHSNRIPKFSITFCGIFTVPFNLDWKSWNFWLNGKRPRSAISDFRSYAQSDIRQIWLTENTKPLICTWWKICTLVLTKRAMPLVTRIGFAVDLSAVSPN